MRIIVHTTPDLIKQYYEDASPISSSIKKTIGDHRSRSRSSKGNISFKSTPKRPKKRKPKDVRIVKIKADNTYDYKLPPKVMESFMKAILNDPDNLKKLKAIYENSSSDLDENYTIMDYINPFDFIVRKIEGELGIQGRDVKIAQSPPREYCT